MATSRSTSAMNLDAMGAETGSETEIAMVATRLITVEDLDRMGRDGGDLELLDGVPREHPGMSVRHGYLGYEIGGPLYVHVTRHHLGRVFTSDTMFMLARDPDTVVKPDVSFIRAARMPPPEALDRIARIAPDFAVEIVSPVDRMADVLAKIGRYQAAGVPLVWLVVPLARSVTVYAAGQEPRTFRDGETLDGGDVIPGFRLPVADIFA